MDYLEWNWKTNDGLEMHAADWLPSGKPRAVVCLIHGLGEHIGRYQCVAEALTDSGYILAGYDIRGFGKSQGPRGFTPSLEAYLDDFDSFLSKVSERYPGVPLFLYGHSMGGMLVLAYAPIRHPAIKGVISSAPGLKSQLETQKFKILLTKVMGRIYPTLSLPSGLDVPEICSDPKVVEIYIKDPLVHTTITTGWGLAMLKAIALAYQNAPGFPFPLLLMHASDDKLGYVSGSEAYAKLAPKEKITFKVWQGLKHEIHNEPERDQVFKVMIDWLNSKI